MPPLDRLVYSPLVYRLVFSPAFMKLMKYASLALSRYYHGDDVVFFNVGYEEDPPLAIPLEAPDEPNRYCIQLYHRTATQVDLDDKRVLEVGCGRGGGASYLMRALHPAAYTGLDLDPTAVGFCRKRHNLPGLDFVRGDAENLPFPDRSFDAVINIESSHCYPRFPRFLAEVARVLRSGGHFLYADLRPRVCTPDWEAALADASMRMLSRVDIEEQVLRVMKTQMTKNSQPPLDQIDRPVPASMHGEATATQGSGLYRAAQRGDFAYRIYCFAKG